jgi:glucose/arabinose dehydrogenase
MFPFLFFLMQDFDLVWQEVLPAGSLTSPVAVVHAEDDRLFLVEQTGSIRIYKEGTLLATPFLDYSKQVRVSWEEGLLGLAFPKAFANSGEFFTTYVRNSDGFSILAKFNISENPDMADPSSEKILLELGQPSPIHKMHALQFALDGTLLIGVGDGGPRWDPDCRGQDPTSLLGKILRLRVEEQFAPPYYEIPADNPFLGQTNFLPELYAMGVRNPWRIGFDRLTGETVVGDVGQNNLEELNLLLPGGNYGWSVMEGTSCFEQGVCQGVPPCQDPSYLPPVFQYSHNPECAIIAGPRVRTWSTLDAWGHWVFADFCSGKIWLARPDLPAWQIKWTGFIPAQITSFGTDQKDNIYAIHQNGSLTRLLAPWDLYLANWQSLVMEPGVRLSVIHMIHRAGIGLGGNQ